MALTPEVYATLGAREREVTRLPYRVGRESLNVSRAHFAIARDDTGYLDRDGIIAGISRGPYVFKFRVG